MNDSPGGRGRGEWTHLEGVDAAGGPSDGAAQSPLQAAQLVLLQDKRHHGPGEEGLRVGRSGRQTQTAPQLLQPARGAPQEPSRPAAAGSGSDGGSVSGPLAGAGSSAATEHHHPAVPAAARGGAH